MDPKLLTESGWKGLALKFKVKDNGLLRALGNYEKIPDHKYAERLKAIASVSQLGSSLQKDAHVADVPIVCRYLDDVIDAADEEEGEISKAKALAEKSAKAEAMAEKDADAETKKREQEEGNYEARLITAMQKLKSAKDLSYEFIVCDAKPHCGLMVAKAITPRHKEELTRLTGGSKRFLHPGTCRFVEGKFTFMMDQPMTGLARKLQASILFYTGKKLPILVGKESAEDDEN
jgi:hypothetical protein